MTTIRNKRVMYTIKKNGEAIIITGKILDIGDQPMIIRWTAPAPVDRRLSLSGSGMPHPNKEAAFTNAQSGRIDSMSGAFNITLIDWPGAYYSGMGSTYVPPHVVLRTEVLSNKILNSEYVIKAGTDNDVPVQNRWISGSVPGTPQNDVQGGRAMHYLWNPDPDGAPRTQEAILRGRGYN